MTQQYGIYNSNHGDLSLAGRWLCHNILLLYTETNKPPAGGESRINDGTVQNL